MFFAIVDGLTHFHNFEMDLLILLQIIHPTKFSLYGHNEGPCIHSDGTSMDVMEKSNFSI
jgi:hypothetical protein